jgi:uncharacterized membrane protein YdjX (TVP38/TMEM64 family)
MTGAAPSPFRFDRSAARTLAGAFVSLGGVGLVFLLGGKLLGFDGANVVRTWLADAAGGPFALPVTVAVFAGLAFLGVPQVVLSAAAVLALGPWRGMSYSWAGTMVSALIGYALGRRLGVAPAPAMPHALRRVVDLVARNGFAASLLVRLAPTVPFVFVNMAAGLSRVGVWDFTAGTALGIAPKIVLTGLAGHALRSSEPHAWLWAGLAAVGWIAMTLAGYVWLRQRRLLGARHNG